MTIKRTGWLTLVTTISLALLYIAILTSQNSPYTTIQNASAQEVFIASNMTGANEVPPVNSMASGTTTLVNNQTFIDYDVSVSDLYNATSAHIHQGKAGENGPIVVTLYETADPFPGLFGGYSGNITSSILEGPLKGKQLSDLVELMNNGQAYVNVHTIKNKDGEIRDQVTPASGNTTGIT